MTREEQRQRKEAKKQTKNAIKFESKQSAIELKAWNKMVEMAKAKGGWIE